MGVFDDVVTYGGNYRSDDTIAWGEGECPNCGHVQFGQVASLSGGDIRWLRCTNCYCGLVENLGVISPAAPPLGVPEGLPPDELRVWQEVRSCLGVGADSAAVLLCRKLLLHIAVSVGMDAKDDNGRAPDFRRCVEYLEEKQQITPKMRQWVDRIRDVGNEATHELQPVTHEQALEVGTYTQQLLAMVYEMDAILAKAMETQSEPGGPPVAGTGKTQ